MTTFKQNKRNNWNWPISVLQLSFPTFFDKQPSYLVTYLLTLSYDLAECDLVFYNVLPFGRKGIIIIMHCLCL